MNENIAAMSSFIEKAGGSVRFDEFSREHLLGEGRGFYSDEIDLSKSHGPVLTPFSSEPEYLSRYARIVLEQAADIAETHGRQIIRICEIGIGGGELFSEVHKIKDQVHNYDHFKIEYTGVDPNRSHVNNLISKGADGHIGVAQHLPLKDSSVELVVAEEVLDSLPYRIFNWDKSTKTITGESFVAINHDRLIMCVQPITPDDNATLVERYLTRINYQYNHYFFSPDSRQFWSEIKRVLTPDGAALVSDYSIESAVFQMLAEKDDLNHERAATETPYRRDLTHFIDPSLQARLAIQAGFPEVRMARMSAIEIDGRVMDLASGRVLILASPQKNGLSDEDLKKLNSLSNRTPGCRNVLSLIEKSPKAGEIIKILTEHGLRGGALWALYSDMADRNFEKFVDLVVKCDKRAFDHARRYCDG